MYKIQGIPSLPSGYWVLGALGALGALDVLGGCWVRQVRWGRWVLGALGALGAMSVLGARCANNCDNSVTNKKTPHCAIVLYFKQEVTLR